MSALPHDGVAVELGGRTYVLPPLSLGSVKRLAKRIQEFSKGDLEAQMDTALAVAHESLRRNYPDLTLQEVENLLDMGNFMRVFEAAMNASGFQARAEGLPGNAAGPGPTTTGQASTPTLPPALAGASTTSIET